MRFRRKRERPIEFIEHSPTSSESVRSVVEQKPELPEFIRTRMQVIEEERFTLEDRCLQLAQRNVEMAEDRKALVTALVAFDIAIEAILDAPATPELDALRAERRRVLTRPDAASRVLQDHKLARDSRR